MQILDAVYYCVGRAVWFQILHCAVVGIIQKVEGKVPLIIQEIQAIRALPEGI